MRYSPHPYCTELVTYLITPNFSLLTVPSPEFRPQLLLMPFHSLSRRRSMSTSCPPLPIIPARKEGSAPA